jgi:hypothetical protein
MDDRSKTFQDNEGNSSLTRVMSFMCLLWSMAVSLITLIKPMPNASVDGVYLVIMFLIAAFAPKVIQKFAEVQRK